MGGLCSGWSSLARLGYRGPCLPANAAWRSSWPPGAGLGRLFLVVIVAAVHAAKQHGRRQCFIAEIAAAVGYQGGAAAHGGQAARDLCKDDFVGVVYVIAHNAPSLARPSSYGANFTTSTPAHSLMARNCVCRGTSSLRAKTRAAGSTAPKPPALFGKMPIN